MKKIIFTILLYTTSIIAQPQKLTLQQSLEIGLKNSKDLKISQSKVISSEAKTTEASSQMLPQLKLAAGYTRLSDVPPFQVVVPFSPAPITISDVILNSYNMRLSLQQPLFTGFRLTSLKSVAGLNSKAAQQDYTKDVNESAFKIQSAFWQYYKAQEMLNLLNENLNQNQKHLEDTKSNLENGLVTQNDLLKIEVQYSNTKLQQIEAQNNLDIAQAQFNQALGYPLNAKTEIDVKELNGNLNAGTQEAYRFEDIMKETKENRDELKSMQYRLQASHEAVSAARSGWMPQVFLNANYYYNRPNTRYQPPVDQFKDSWDVGVSLNWDIWNWGLTSSQTTQAEETAVQTETTLSQLNDAVEVEVYANYLTYQRSLEKITVSRQSVEQAKENSRIINDKFNVQLATSTDLIDAETSVLQAGTNYNNALVDYQIAKLRLEKSIGRKIY